MSKLLIIDSHAILFKAHFAFGSRPLTNSKGMVTSALYGFLRVFFQLIRREKPDYLCFAFDTSRQTFRRDMYSEYKAHRSETPKELVDQFPYAIRLAEALQAKVLALPGYEADDILGSLSVKATQMDKDLQVLLITGDRDSFQLINDRVKVGYTSSKAESGIEEVDIAGVATRYDGLSPSDLITVKALMGDSSDNIPGISGVGEKTAIKLVKDFKSLDNLYQNLDSLKGKLKEKVESSRELAYLSRDLATIRCDLDLGVTLSDLQFELKSSQPLTELLDELEFSSLKRELPEVKLPLVTKVKDYSLISTEAELESLGRRLSNVPVLALDTETDSLNPHEARLVGVSLSVAINQGYYIPLSHRYLGCPAQLDLESVKTLLNHQFQRPDLLVVGHNLKFDLTVLLAHGVCIPKNLHDTLLMAHLLMPLERIGLKELAQSLLFESREHFSDLVSKDDDFRSVRLETALQYAAADADNSLELYQLLWPQLNQDEQLLKMYQDLEMPLMPVLLAMESRGIAIDPEVFSHLQSVMEAEASRVARLILDEAQEDINLNSTQQLAKVLFEKLNIPHGKKTKSGYSTATDVLEELAPHYPICARILEHRHLQKLLSTYVLPLPKQADARQRVHTSFSQTIAATGRLSSVHPNLQNIPVRTEWGTKIRQGFVPKSGYILASIDYSQIELRVMAHMASDKAMCEAFARGRDIHRETAAQIFRKDLDEVTKSERESAKAINFGIIYGMGSFSLSRQLGIAPKMAEGFIDSYFHIYSGIKQFMDETAVTVFADGAVRTMFGRLRPIPEAKSSNKNHKESGRRVAINTRIQGSAAEILKLAMIKIDQFINSQALKTAMLLQVHDELIFEVPEDEMSVLPELVKLMQEIVALQVPLVCDLETGPSWGQLVKS